MAEVSQEIGGPPMYVKKEGDSISAGIVNQEKPLSTQPPKSPSVFSRMFKDAHDFLVAVVGGPKAKDLVSPEMAEFKARQGQKVGQKGSSQLPNPGKPEPLTVGRPK